MNFSFAGCGFLGIYHVGVASCLKQHSPHLVQNCHFAGASAGAIVACCLLCDCCLGDCTTFTLKLAIKARSYYMGSLHPDFQLSKILKATLWEVLPDNAHEIVSGKLHISLTRFTTWQNVIVSEFNSKEELIQALLCSAHVPFYSGWNIPAYRGLWYWDGGLSNNIPVLNDQTVRISPFAGQSDICPKDKGSSTLHIELANTSMQLNMANFLRLSCALQPPDPEKLSDMCKQGFDDTLKYLQDNKLLSCVRHLRVRSIIRQVPVEERECEENIITEEQVEEAEQPCEHESCSDCKKTRQIALLDKLPHVVGSALQDAIDEVDKGMVVYYQRHRSLRIISLISTPWYLPVDISATYAIRFLNYLPDLPSDVQKMYCETANLLRYFLTNIHCQKRRYIASFACRLAITEVKYNEIETDICPVQHQPLPDYTNLNFAFDLNMDSDLAKRHSTSIDGIPQHIDRMHLHYDHRPRSDSANAILSSKSPLFQRKSSESRGQSTDTKVNTEMFDTFEQCLHVTNQMDAVMAYHYQDENNKGCYKVEEIYSFREEDIDLSTFTKHTDSEEVDADLLFNQSEKAIPKKWKSTSHLEHDLESFVGQRSDLAFHRHSHQQNN